LANQDPAAGLHSALLRFFSEVNGHFWGVVSEPVADPSGLPEAFQTGTRGLDLMAALGRDKTILHARDLALYSPLLAGAPGQHLDGFLRTSLEGLFDPRDARRIELARTLLAYLDNSYNARLAASAMAIHINTFRQRLESIDAMLGPWRKA